MSNETYEIIHRFDEVIVKEATCKYPWMCICKFNYIGPKCGYTAEECKQYFIDYYRKRAEYIEKLTPEEFMLEAGGIYPK